MNNLTGSSQPFDIQYLESSREANSTLEMDSTKEETVNANCTSPSDESEGEKTMGVGNSGFDAGCDD